MRAGGWVLWLLVVATAGLRGGEISVQMDDATGWALYTLRQKETEVRVVPQAGANAYFMEHRGVQYLRVPEDLSKLRGVSYGNPILYPMPNRVRGAQFQFDGTTYKFPPNGRGNFIHGLVHSEPFTVAAQGSDADSAWLICELQFREGVRPYEFFPWGHVFRVKIQVKDASVVWTYEVENKDRRELPFGVAFHPYFIYQQTRAETYLQVPASHLMEATHQLPSGELLELDGHALDARKPRSLLGYNADDVFFGMHPARPARVEFRDAQRSVTFKASPEFTHLVVYTPDRPFFCIENQTCSTDAHNLAAQGKNEVAHLQICPPGQTKSGSLTYFLE